MSAGSLRTIEVTLRRGANVRVEVTGKKHVGKGFQVYRVVGADQIANLMKRKKFKHDPRFHGLKVSKFRTEHEVSRGRMAFAVVNSENLLDPIVVRVKITANPR